MTAEDKLGSYATQKEKDEAIETIRLLMQHSVTDASYRLRAQDLERALARPVRPDPFVPTRSSLPGGPQEVLK